MSCLLLSCALHTCLMILMKSAFLIFLPSMPAFLKIFTSVVFRLRRRLCSAMRASGYGMQGGG